MAALCRNAALAVLVLALNPVQDAAAADPISFTESKEPIILDADSSEIDRKNDRLMFSGVNITQGTTNIRSDSAQASTLDFANSKWVFEGNVQIRLGTTQIDSNLATMTFADYQLASAMVEGDPAAFRQVAKNQELTEGHAQLIEYDGGKGTIRLSKGAWLSEGGKEISGNTLTYNIQEERVIASSDKTQGEKVLIVINPEADEEADQQDQADD